MVDKSSSRWLNWNYEKKKKKLTETLELTLSLFRQGRSVKQIAKEREYKLQTIEYQVVELITLGFVDVDDVVVNVHKKKILNSIKRGVPQSLKEIKNEVPEEVTYFEIKCVLADLNRDPEQIY